MCYLQRTLPNAGHHCRRLRPRQTHTHRIRNQQKLFVFAHKQRVNVFAGTKNNALKKTQSTIRPEEHYQRVKAVGGSVKQRN